MNNKFLPLLLALMMLISIAAVLAADEGGDVSATCYCGDGTINGNEQCDDGSISNGGTNGVIPTPGYGETLDYCTTSCTIATVTGPYCGDDHVDAGYEACDDGAANTDSPATQGYGETLDYCTTSCTTATETGPYCGDGLVQSAEGEDCDDGNNVNWDSCTNDCENVADIFVTATPATVLGGAFNFTVETGSCEASDGSYTTEETIKCVEGSIVTIDNADYVIGSYYFTGFTDDCSGASDDYEDIVTAGCDVTLHYEEDLECPDVEVISPPDSDPVTWYSGNLLIAGTVTESWPGSGVESVTTQISDQFGSWYTAIYELTYNSGTYYYEYLWNSSQEVICSDANVKIWATDFTGNKCADTNKFGIDNAPPVTTKDWSDPYVACVDDENCDLYVTNETLFNFTADDCGIGVDETYYQINGGATTVYDGAFNLEPGCGQTITYWSVDLLGNTENSTVEIDNVDTLAPTTIKTFAGPSVDNVTGDHYYVTTATQVTLTATDNSPDDNACPVGVDYIRYEIWWDSDDDGIVDTLKANETVYDDSVTFSFTEESIHEIRWYAVDLLGNVEGWHTQEHAVDDTEPTIWKVVGEPKVLADENCDANTEVCDYYVTQATNITLYCVDPQPHPVSDVTMHFAWYVVQDQAWSDEFIVNAENHTFTYPTDSEHELYFWCTDALGNTAGTDGVYETDYVDTQAPASDYAISGPYYIDQQAGKTYLDNATRISLTCEDTNPHPVGANYTMYRYRVDSGNWTNWTLYEAPFGFPEESHHELEYYCVDLLGNTETANSVEFYVDHTKPVTTHSYDTPYYTNGTSEWITSATPITLTATDDFGYDHDSGVAATYYRYMRVADEYCAGTATQDLIEDDWQVWFQGFETDREGFLDYYGNLTRVVSGTNGVTSATGTAHAILNKGEVTEGGVYDGKYIGPFTRWGGYSSVFPAGGYTTSIDIYLDTAWADGTDKRLDFSSAASKQDGSHLRDFIMHIGTVVGTPGSFVASASNSAPGWPANPARNPVTFDQSGWYTIKHVFYDAGDGTLAVDVQLYRQADGQLIGSWTLNDASDLIATIVGGNRYGWFATNDFDNLPVDNAQIDYDMWRTYDDEFTIPEDSCHVIEYYSVDNVDKTEAMHETFVYVDTLAPTTSIAVSDPKLPLAGGDWLINDETNITLACADNDPHPVGGETIHWSWRYSEDNITWTDWSNPALYDGAIQFDESSYHELEYWCVDRLGNEEEHQFALDAVDLTAPVSEKNVSEPKVQIDPSCDPTQEVCDYWVTSETEITLACQDADPHPSGHETIYYRYYLDGVLAQDWMTYTEPISFAEDSNHTLEWYCTDYFGNEETVQSELDKVDNAAPNISKYVRVNDGEAITEGTVAVKSGDSLLFCAEVKDYKLTGDAGVGVDEVWGRLSALDDPQMTLTPSEGDDVYCFQKTVPYNMCGNWHYEVKANDSLGNEADWTNGIEVIVDNVPPVGEVLNPHSGNYYRDGKSFWVYMPVIDFGGSVNELFEYFVNDECPASHVDYCTFYAIDYNFEGINQSEVKNVWDYLDEIGAMDATVAELGTVPATVEGNEVICQGQLTIPENSNLTETVFLAVDIVDHSGNKYSWLALNPWLSPITMNIDNEGPGVMISDRGNLPGPVTSGDYINVEAEVIDYKSGFDDCWADVYTAVGGELGNDTGIDLMGTAVDFDTCEINDELPLMTGDGPLTSGQYYLVVNARDEQFNIGSNTTTYMIVDNDRPDMGVIAPLPGDAYSNLVPISMALDDDSGIANETVLVRIGEKGFSIFGWCLSGCKDTGWLPLTNLHDNIYAGTINLTDYGFEEDGTYQFDAVACDPLYLSDLDDNSGMGFDINMDRNAMHCRQIGEHGALELYDQTACNDGMDNDGDGYSDFDLDNGCYALDDPSEEAVCGNGYVEGDEACDGGEDCNAYCEIELPYVGSCVMNATPDWAIFKDGNYWAWASPCDGGCSNIEPIAVPGWRYATADEWANRPAVSDFGTSSDFVCAASVFDPTYNHCDYSNAADGLVTSEPTGNYWETWLIYDCSAEDEV